MSTDYDDMDEPTLDEMEEQLTGEKKKKGFGMGIAIKGAEEPKPAAPKAPLMKGAQTKEEIKEQEEKEAKEAEEEEKKEEAEPEEEEFDFGTHIFALRTAANREDQVMDFITSNIVKKKIDVRSVVRPHGMRGYIFLEAGTQGDAEQAAYNVPYARGILPKEIQYKEIEHMLEQVKRDINIQKNDIAEIIAGPFKREKCKITRVDKTKEEVVVELLEAAVPIPMTLKMDAIKVIRRESDEQDEDAEGLE